MEKCNSCGVRFRRDIFRECPGCGVIIDAFYITGVTYYTSPDDDIFLVFDKVKTHKTADLLLPGWPEFDFEISGTIEKKIEEV